MFGDTKYRKLDYRKLQKVISWEFIGIIGKLVFIGLFIGPIGVLVLIGLIGVLVVLDYWSD